MSGKLSLSARHFLYILFLLVGVFFLFGSSTPALAQPIDDTKTEEDPTISFYVAQYGVSREEAAHRLEIQSDSARIIESVMREIPTYAGGWIEHEPVFQLVFAVTDPDEIKHVKEIVNKLNWVETLDVRLADKTLPELEAELARVKALLVEDSEVSKIVFGTGLDIIQGTILVETSDIGRLTEIITERGIENSGISLDNLNLEYRESPHVPAQLKYPLLPGGQEISTCTTGYAVTSGMDGRKYMTTAGHCGNSQNVVFGAEESTDTFLGPVFAENDAISNPVVGPMGNTVDLQVHDISVRDFDLSNLVRVGSNTVLRVTAAHYKHSTLGWYVCKYGMRTYYTCGTVVNLNFAPQLHTANTFVRVHNSSMQSEIACKGDSGGSVFVMRTGFVEAVGSLSTTSSTDPVTCQSVSHYFSYAPVDQFVNFGYYIITTDHPQRYYQNVFWTQFNCVQYSGILDDYGNVVGQQSQSCPTSLGGSGALNSYTAHVVADKYHEGGWQGGYGYVRTIPLYTWGAVNWGSPNYWQTFPFSNFPARAQDEYVIGNYSYQKVFAHDNVCTLYKYPLDLNGNRDYSQPNHTTPCPTILPGSGDIQSYTAWVVNDQLREAMWRNNIGYTRTLQLNAEKTDVDGAWTQNWTQCCTGTAPQAQSVYILNHQ